MRKDHGQSLVEFALVLPLFLALVVGLLDGARLLFTYNELQEAARAGARWGAVEVNRSPWGDFTYCGNAPSYSPYPTAACSITATSGLSSTIVGQVDRKLIAVNPNQATISISTTAGITSEAGIQDGAYTSDPVTVTVAYTFTPVLGFNRIAIPLVGRATLHHA